MRRRQFLTAAGLASLATLTPKSPAVARVRRAGTPLKLLILGGTRFIGVHMTELALARGHSVTFFNRGRTKTDLFPQIERIRGDRNGELEGLRGRGFDAVIDNSGYVPRHVRMSAELLRAQAPRYVFISSVSVYPDFAAPRDETSAVGKLADPTIEKVDGDTYGPLKALCERAAIEIYGEQATILRPGLIVGPDDNTDRFTYWPARAARGGEMIAPGTPRDAIQIIDARDLAAFTMRAIELRIGGTYNIVSPPGMFTIGRLVAASIAAARRLVKNIEKPRATWLPAKFLEEQKVEPWSDLPVWLPPTGETAAFAATSTSRAEKAGLTIRRLEATVTDTLAWHLKRPAAEREQLKAGIKADREQEVLRAWHALGK